LTLANQKKELILAAMFVDCQVSDTSSVGWASSLAMPMAPHSKKQQNHTNIECSVYLMFKVCCLSW
jgi:hypothetical protein